MDIKQFKQILKEFEKSTIHKLEITEKDFAVKMEKKRTGYQVPITNQTINEEPIDKTEVTPPVDTRYFEVKSPLVGIFYGSPSPESQSFVKVNQKVQKGDILCIVEAMKVMNEIRSPISGVVKKINRSDEVMVEYGEVIIEIEQDNV